MLSSDPAKRREWQQRSQQRAVAKMRDKGRQLAPREAKASVRASDYQDAVKSSRRAKQRPNDGPWRKACVEAYGERCKNCGDTHHVEMDHIIPKSQDRGARADVENGLPLCGSFSRNTPGGCHPSKTASKLRFKFEWFTPAQIEYLAQKQWVWWDENGTPQGRGHKHFEPRIVRAR